MQFDSIDVARQNRESNLDQKQGLKQNSNIQGLAGTVGFQQSFNQDNKSQKHPMNFYCAGESFKQSNQSSYSPTMLQLLTDKDRFLLAKKQENVEVLIQLTHSTDFINNTSFVDSMKSSGAVTKKHDHTAPNYSCADYQSQNVNLRSSSISGINDCKSDLQKEGMQPETSLCHCALNQLSHIMVQRRSELKIHLAYNSPQYYEKCVDYVMLRRQIFLSFEGSDSIIKRIQKFLFMTDEAGIHSASYLLLLLSEDDLVFGSLKKGNKLSASQGSLIGQNQGLLTSSSQQLEKQKQKSWFYQHSLKLQDLVNSVLCDASFGKLSKILAIQLLANLYIINKREVKGYTKQKPTKQTIELFFETYKDLKVIEINDIQKALKIIYTTSQVQKFLHQRMLTNPSLGIEIQEDKNKVDINQLRQDGRNNIKPALSGVENSLTFKNLIDNYQESKLQHSSTKRYALMRNASFDNINPKHEFLKSDQKQKEQKRPNLHKHTLSDQDTKSLKKGTLENMTKLGMQASPLSSDQRIAGDSYYNLANYSPPDSDTKGSWCQNKLSYELIPHHLLMASDGESPQDMSENRCDGASIYTTKTRQKGQKRPKSKRKWWQSNKIGQPGTDLKTMTSNYSRKDSAYDNLKESILFQERGMFKDGSYYVPTNSDLSGKPSLSANEYQLQESNSVWWINQQNKKKSNILSQNRSDAQQDPSIFGRSSQVKGTATNQNNNSRVLNQKQSFSKASTSLANNYGPTKRSTNHEILEEQQTTRCCFPKIQSAGKNKPSVKQDTPSKRFEYQREDQPASSMKKGMPLSVKAANDKLGQEQVDSQINESGLQQTLITQNLSQEFNRKSSQKYQNCVVF